MVWPVCDVRAGPYHSVYRARPLSFEVDGTQYAFNRVSAVAVPPAVPPTTLLPLCRPLSLDHALFCTNHRTALAPAHRRTSGMLALSFTLWLVPGQNRPA